MVHLRISDCATLTVGVGGEVEDLADGGLLGHRRGVGLDVDGVLRPRLQVVQQLRHVVRLAVSVRLHVSRRPADQNKQGNVSFNDALNTFYLRLYGHMLKDHSDSERGNPLPPQKEPGQG